MIKKSNNSTKIYRLYILFEQGRWMQPDVVKLLVNYVTRDAVLEDFGTGSAYNNPGYLIDAIENHVDNAMVVAWDMDGNQPHPRFYVGVDEIEGLIEVLKLTPDGDSWEIAVEFNKVLRAVQAGNYEEEKDSKP